MATSSNPTVLPSVESHTRRTIDTLFSFLIAQGKTDYLGEAVTQLEHSLQCAHLAQQDIVYGVDDEVVLAALLHDVGRFIPAAEKMYKMYNVDGEYIGPASHEILGEQYLRDLGFSDKVANLVGAHVLAKRYLTATDQTYYDGLSETSKKTLIYQGGVFNQEQIKEAQQDPLLGAKLAVRRWDDLAKVPNIEVPPLSDYKEISCRCLLRSRTKFKLHSKEYRLPQQPTVVICIDGFNHKHLESGMRDEILPIFKKLTETGFQMTAKGCLPASMNANNVSIITGMPPSVDRIAGNISLARETGNGKMVAGDSTIRGSTLLEQMSLRGIRVAAVTAEDKLRKILAHGLKEAICFSAESAAHCTFEENGIEDVEKWIGRSAPSRYSNDLSLFVLDAGIRLLEEQRSDFLYLTLSNHIQNDYASGDRENHDFMKKIDARLQKLVGLAPIVAVTGNHEMRQESNADGEPSVLFLEDALSKEFGAGSARVICPVIDLSFPNEGTLGSFVSVYPRDMTQLDDMVIYCCSFPHVERVLTGAEIAEQYNMAPYREEGFVVISKSNAVIGSRKEDHHSSQVRYRTLDSHCDTREQDIPIIASKPARDVNAATAKSWKNYDIFDLALNWV